MIILVLVKMYLVDSFFDDAAEVLNEREVGQDFGEDGEGVPDLDIVLGLEAHHQGLGDLVVPLVTHVAVVLVVDVVVGLVLFLVGGLFVRLNAELGHEARVADALLLEDVLGRVPPVGSLQHGSQEPPITLSLVLRA